MRLGKLATTIDKIEDNEIFAAIDTETNQAIILAKVEEGFIEIAAETKEDYAGEEIMESTLEEYDLFKLPLETQALWRDA